jgi:hypothetical protein
LTTAPGLEREIRQMEFWNAHISNLVSEAGRGRRLAEDRGFEPRWA